MFIRNCWYVAGWDDVLKDQELFACVIANEPIVIYRKADGGLVALQDRCCHRAAPLSIGRREGDHLRCLYHGLRFDESGQCVEIPGQDRIPPQARVRSFPVIERGNYLWVWMGDAEDADPALIPPTVALDDPDWIFRHGYMDYDASYQLVHDNLLDFSHLTYVHPDSFGVGEDWALTRPKVTRNERSVRVERWLPDQPVPNHIRSEVETETLDMWMYYDFYVPGVMIMYSQGYPGGTAALCNGEAPVGIEPVTSDVTNQSITPISAQRSRYCFSWAPRAKGGSPELADGMIAIARMAFGEDRDIIEAQQRSLNLAPDAKLVPTTSDTALGQFRWIIERMLKAEEESKVNPVVQVAAQV
ncbi:Toluene-4-sulfonate monooxygenase system iron-sulfur subunit TsaM1 [compost metagenome]